MKTAHLEADIKDIARTVLMPGDPLRAKYIAESYLEKSVQFNSIRNILGYTGNYKGKKVSILASGMGLPSIGIYSYELYSKFGVENIIRVGSAGAYVEDLKLHDIVLASQSYSESTYAKVQSGFKGNITYPSRELNNSIIKKATELKTSITQEKIHSTDVFYVEEGGVNFKEVHTNYGCTCVEMESFALFHTANILEKQAACLLTISDSLAGEERISAKQRESSFDKMIVLALETVVDI